MTTADRDVPTEYQGTLEPTHLCRAWNPRRQKYCRSGAGWGTSHKGVGRCRVHDGGGDLKTRHGQKRRYGHLTHERLREKIERHADDPAPLDVLPELAAARALFEDFLERYEEHTAALLAWHRSWQGGQATAAPERLEAFRRVLDEYEAVTGGEDELSEAQREDLTLARALLEALTAPAATKPHVVLDVSDAVRHADTISKIVERIERIRAANAIALPDLERLLFELGRIVKAHVKDPAVAAKIEEGWLAVRL